LKDHFSIEEMMKFYDQKYKCLEQKKYHILKSLSYFEDAEDEEMPKMLKPIAWEDVKNYFIKEVGRLAKEWGLN
jgi:hypothetical protein